MRHGTHEPALRAVEVDLRPEGAPVFAATVRLRGEHDVATRHELEDVLGGLPGDVLVDLSACELIDSSVIAVLLAGHYARRRQGHRLELLVPAENTLVTRTLEVSGASRLLTVHDTRP